MAKGKDGYVVKKFDKDNSTLDDVAKELERLKSKDTYRMPDGNEIEGEYDLSGDGMCIKFYPNRQAKRPKSAEQVLAESGIDEIE